MEKKLIVNHAHEKLHLCYELSQGKNRQQQELRWGAFIVYKYLHTQEVLWEVVTFENKEDAEVYLQSILEEWGPDTQPSQDPFNGKPDERAAIKGWDETVRRGINWRSRETVGLIEPEILIELMPIKSSLEFLVALFRNNLILAYER